MEEVSRRHRQVANRIREELVTIARKEISDPRLERVGMITFSGVDLTQDMRNATVWVSFMGKQEKDADVQAALAALESAGSFIHRLLIKRIPMKIHPRLHFKFDRMFDRADVVSQALHEAAEVESETARYRAEHPEPSKPDEEE
jgi:ribosome-binding factor A